ncbi:FAD synthetase family protein [Treponema phagedenis]|uniref:FAD synthetase family protein n=1 Tax=Treponema phagedenis TaxID=162 RepID=UPI0011EDB88D|nr:FAD synthetase family protein [Treponema phagedenis]TYT78638.1 FAD synthetase family protein [Treponema phagedenis]
MEIFSWDALVKAKAPLITQGAAVSIGGFDGPHRGHVLLFEKVFEAAKKENLKAGLITFSRSPRFKKAGENYVGDVSTLRLRLQKFEELGFDFIVLIDFSCSFARIEGVQFFDILLKTIRIRYLAVGTDFRCGYRLDTGVPELIQLGSEQGFRFDSIGQLTAANNLRISSSAVRVAVEKADFTLAKDLLGYPFLLDIKDVFTPDEQKVCSYKAVKQITQILPPDGRYSVKVFLTDKTTVVALLTIHEGSIVLTFDSIQKNIPAEEKDFDTVEFIQKE